MHPMLMIYETMLPKMILDKTPTSGIETARMLADWIEDNNPVHPEAEQYIKRLRRPETLRLRTLLDAGIKLGDKQTRKILSKIVRRALRQRTWSKGCMLAFLKKAFSLKMDWLGKQRITLLLESELHRLAIIGRVHVEEA